MAFVNEKKPDGKRQTIDRERDVVLVYLRAGNGEYPVEFELWLGEKKIRFEAFLRSARAGVRGEGGHIAMWDIVHVYIPSDLEQYRPDILLYIKEGLEEFGLAASRKNIESVHVNFETLR